MNGINTQSNAAAIRAQIWSSQLRLALEPELLFINNWLDEITDFPDGDKFTDLEMGSATVRDYNEGAQVRFDGIDIGSRDFVINNYKSSGQLITDKMRMDSFIVGQIEANLPAREARALMADLETTALKMWATLQPIANDAYKINGFSHKFVAGYDSAPNATDYGVINPEDMIYGAMALMRAGYTGAPTAIISPYAAYLIQTGKYAKTHLTFQPIFGKIVEGGAMSGFRFAFNMGGVDIYVSNFIDSTASELTLKTREGVESSLTRVGSADACIMFANEPGRRPVRIAWRKRPYFEGWWDADVQSEKYLTICRYGIGAGDKENFITIITKNADTTSFTAA